MLNMIRCSYEFIIYNVNMISILISGPNSIETMCPHCQSQVRTSTESEPGALAWILAGILCVVGYETQNDSFILTKNCLKSI